MIKARWLFPVTFVFLGSTPIYADLTLIAPMVEGLNWCKSAMENLAISDVNEAVQYCRNKKESAAQILDDELRKIGPSVSKDGQFGLGYTLNLPLLSYIEVEGGQFKIKRERIKQDLQVLSDSDRKVVVYFFANHFVYDEAIATADFISQDEGSLMKFADGTNPADKYFGAAVIPWSAGNDKSRISEARMLAMNAAVAEVCNLPASDLEKIHAVTTLGETHHFFPNFKSGMGYEQNYRITDYSDYSVRGFQTWLEESFQHIEHLNAVLQSRFENFTQVRPPSKNINTDQLNSFFEHIDAYAHGSVPFFGWAYDIHGKAITILVYLDGQYIGEASVGLTRLDVAQSISELNDSNVGYRYDLDFSSLSPGIHNIEMRFLNEGKTSLLKQYQLAVMDRAQSRPKSIQPHILAEAQESTPEVIRFWSDHPNSLMAVYYNPLAKLWNDYREYQINKEIEKYAQVLAQSCLDRNRVYSAQIGTMYNASWNPNYFAVDKSMQKNPDFAVGVNLYGGVVYGDTLFNWLKNQGHEKYGVPEMHPMTPQNPIVLAEAIRRHRRHGAHFLSPYYVSFKPSRFGLDPEHEKFRLSPNNPDYGSAQYFDALRLIMNTNSINPGKQAKRVAHHAPAD